MSLVKSFNRYFMQANRAWLADLFMSDYGGDYPSAFNPNHRGAHVQL